MSLTVTVAGTARPIKRGSLNITLVANGLSRVTCEFDSIGAIYRPSIDDELVIANGADTLIGGYLNALPEAGLLDQPVANIATKVSGNDYATLANRRYVNEMRPAESLKARLTAFIPYLPAGFAIDPAQPTGPTLIEQTYTFVKLTDALNGTTTESSGYIWGIDPATKYLSSRLPASLPCPFDITDANGFAVGDIQVEPTRNDFYANTVIGTINAQATTEPILETLTLNAHTASSWTTFFPSVAPSVYWPGVIFLNGVSVPIGPYEPGLGSASFYQLQWDDVTHTVYQRPGEPLFPVGTTLAIRYGATARIEDAHVDTFNGDGVTATFTLAGRVVSTQGYVLYADATNDQVAETLGAANATWILDTLANTITSVLTPPYRVNPPPTGSVMSITYRAAFLSSSIVSASDAGEIAAHGIWETVIQLPPDASPALAQALVAQELARRKVLQKLVHVKTYQTGARPGMSQTIQSAKRGISSSTFLIQEVNIVDQGLASGDLLYSITALASPLFQPTWQSTVKQWSQTGGGATLAPAVAGGVAVPALPHRSMQFEDGGVFGGSEFALFDKDFSGDSYGSGGFAGPARFALGVASGNPKVQAWFNKTAGKALAAWAEVDNLGRFDLYGQGPETEITALNGELGLNADTNAHIAIGNRFANYILMEGTTVLQGLSAGFNRITANTTLDTSGSQLDTVVYHDSASNHTLTLTDVTAAPVLFSTNLQRVLIVKNGTAGGMLTIAVAAGQTIEGSATMVLGPGASTILVAKSNTGTLGSGKDWKAIAGSGAGTGSGGGGTATAAGSDGDIQYAASALLAASDAFNFSASLKRLYLTIDRTEYNTGEVLRIYGSGVDPVGAPLVFLDIEPGLDRLVSGAANQDIYAQFHWPTYSLAATGTHGLVVNHFFGAGAVTEAGAGVTRAATVYIDGSPGDGNLGGENYALLIDGGTLGFPYALVGQAIDYFEAVGTGAPSANTARVYAEDNGSGKTKLMVRFNTGSAIQIAIEP